MTLAMRAADEIAQIPVFLAHDEALILHPEIVVELREVARARVGRQRDDALGRVLLTAIAQRGRKQRAELGVRPRDRPHGTLVPAPSTPIPRAKHSARTHDRSDRAGARQTAQR